MQSLIPHSHQHSTSPCPCRHLGCSAVPHSPFGVHCPPQPLFPLHPLCPHGSALPCRESSLQHSRKGSGNSAGTRTLGSDVGRECGWWEGICRAPSGCAQAKPSQCWFRTVTWCGKHRGTIPASLPPRTTGSSSEGDWSTGGVKEMKETTPQRGTRGPNALPEQRFTHTVRAAPLEPLLQQLGQSALCWTQLYSVPWSLPPTRNKELQSQARRQGAVTNTDTPFRVLHVQSLLVDSCLSSIGNSREASKGKKHWVSMAAALTFYLVVDFVYFFQLNCFWKVN